MFILLSVEDKVVIDPGELNPNDTIPSPQNVVLPSIHNIESPKKDEESKRKVPEPFNDVVYKRLRNKYISKILLGQGIVVSIQKFTIKSCLIVEIEGVINVEYDCSLIVFKPQVGDILYGKIIQSSINQVIVDCDLIKVKVPFEQIMKPNNFDENENVWYWSYGQSNYYYDLGEEVRVKVVDLQFKNKNDITIIINKNAEIEKNNTQLIKNESMNKEGSQMEEEPIELTKDMIMEITCTFNEEGLGPLKWWNGINK